MPGDLDFRALGFKCGLEIHQQLDTERKLFCKCHARLRLDPPHASILRHMRPTLSEMGTYDGTALMEFKTKKNVTYQLYEDGVCTYEMDDTPPFPINQDALDIALEIAMMMGCSVVDEVHVSRKQYLDGSIPTGFQRTAIVGVEGSVPFKGRELGVIQLSIEEDACREVSDSGHEIVFKTDRLSIPLVEVVTKAEIRSPSEVPEAALHLGRFMRATGKVRRGLGATRQDVNVSIDGGTRVEIKGVPKIQWMEALTRNEAIRQKALLEIRDILRSRGVTEGTMQTSAKDLTHIFKRTKCGPIMRALAKGGVVKGIKLCGFGGLLARDVMPGVPFKHEFAGRVKVIACLDEPLNIAHTDELPAHGLTQKERASVEKEMDDRHFDVTVLAWGPSIDVDTAVKEIRIRALDAINGVPSETRQPFEDGTTGFERILPGPDRMYPDTDSPPVAITQERVRRIRSGIVEAPWTREERYVELGLSANLASELAISKWAKLFDRLVGEGHRPKFVAAVLVEGLRGLHRKGVDISALPDSRIAETFSFVRNEGMSLSSVLKIIERLPSSGTVPEAAGAAGQVPATDEEIARALGDASEDDNIRFMRAMSGLRGRASPERTKSYLKIK
jgi:glutamyl-tRNA(Gln) amidotransferase subunit E